MFFYLNSKLMISRTGSETKRKFRDTKKKFVLRRITQRTLKNTLLIMVDERPHIAV